MQNIIHTVGEGEAARPIAVRQRQGKNPGLAWLGGYRSDMIGTKAEALDAWAAENGHACLRHDYSGHGESGGEFMDGTISRVKRAIPMLLRRGGHPLRRLHFLKELDERGMIDDSQVGTRGGVI